MRLTTRCVVDIVIGAIYDEASEANDDGDQAQREYTNESYLLTLAELETVDDEERETKN